MQFYSIFRSILHQLPPGKRVTLDQTVEGSSKNSDLFTGVQWHLLRVPLINVAVLDYNVLYKEVVFHREW